MRPDEPRGVATWLLEHLVPGPRNDALAGDLLEDFRCGRSKTWYWRQVLVAIVLGVSRESRIHLGLMFFAASWAMLAPAWLRLLANSEQHFNLTERFDRMDWPWSIVSDVGFLLAANVLFIWTGMALYLIPHLWAARNLRVQPLGGGIRASLPVLVALWATLVLLPKYFLGQPVDWPAANPVVTYPVNEPGPIVRTGNSGQAAHRGSISPIKRYMAEHPPPTEAALIRKHEDWVAAQRPTTIVQTSSPSAAITDMRTAAILVRLPFFLIVLSALWGAASRFESRNHRIVD
jgi:hypothetical protein